MSDVITRVLAKIGAAAAVGVRVYFQWHICGRCHQLGAKWPHPRIASHAHRLGKRGLCDDCGQRRVLVWCWHYDWYHERTLLFGDMQARKVRFGGVIEAGASADSHDPNAAIEEGTA